MADEIPPHTDADAPPHLYAVADAAAAPVPLRAKQRDQRVLPHHIGLEVSILGGILLKPSILRMPELVLETDDFYDPRNKAVWSAMVNLDADGNPIDLATLEAALEDVGKLDAIGGVAYLGELALRVPTPDNVLFYAAEVREKSDERRIMLVSSEISTGIGSGKLTAREAADRMAAEMAKIGRIRAVEAPARQRPRVLTNADAYDELLKLEGLPIYETPLPSLNAAIGYGGLIAGGVYDIVAGPGVGKSSLAVFVAGAIADSFRALYATWEQQPGRLLGRLAAGRLKRASNLISRNATREEILGAAPTGMRWMSKPTLDELEEAVVIVGEEIGRAPIVVTDYVQRMAEAIMRTQAKPDARLASAEASERLTVIAERTGCCVLAVAAASRAGRVKAADARKLHPSDLIDVARESSGIEFDSSGLLVLSDTGDTDEDGWKVRTLTVAKARYGEVCHIDLRLDGASGLYSDAGRISEIARKAKEEAKDEVMREEIRESLKAAGDALSKRQIRQREDAKGKVHRWVKGREPDVRMCVDRMVADGELRQIGSLYALSGGGK